jgi:hypothetical protein
LPSAMILRIGRFNGHQEPLTQPRWQLVTHDQRFVAIGDRRTLGSHEQIAEFVDSHRTRNLRRLTATLSSGGRAESLEVTRSRHRGRRLLQRLFGDTSRPYFIEQLINVSHKSGVRPKM